MAQGGALLRSSIGRKQLVAVTGVGLFIFVILHLTGNLLIYSGPETFNGYAEKLAHLRPMLYGLEVFLLATAVVHIFLIMTLLWENRRARGARYAVCRAVGKRWWSSRTMSITGPLLLTYVIFHLADFTFGNVPVRGMVAGEDLGLYGTVYKPSGLAWHGGLYVAAMVVLGLHLSHALQSACQTFGLTNARYLPHVRNLSVAAGVLVAALYISIPLSIKLGWIGPH